MSNTTTNFSLQKFVAGQSGWADSMNNNLDTIDAHLGQGGSGGIQPYTFTQGSPLDTWVVVHNLNRYPIVSVIDSAGNWVVGAIHYDSLNQLTLNFSGAFSGTAVLI